MSLSNKLFISLTIAFALVFTNALGESASFSIPPPLKQITKGTAAQDVICNSGLTLVQKLHSDSSACVKPTTAIKLQERGWAKMLKDSAMMEDQRMKMLEKEKIDEKQEPVVQEKPTHENATENTPTQEKVEPAYNPEIIPRNFVPAVNNKFFPLAIGTTFIYESELEEGTERTEVSVTDDKMDVMGVGTTVVWDRVWLDDNLIEDTKDWFAQDKDGNVWYFGEDSKEYSDGKVVNTEGSWQAGIDGAKPGIIMKANPNVGEIYRQEYYSGIAEDMAEVVSLNETVSVSYGKFTGCIKIREWNPLESDVNEFKYYCPQIGVVMETNPDEDEMMELVDVKVNGQSTVIGTGIDITIDEAKQIALKAVPGTVTDIEKDVIDGRVVYVIEVAAKTGIETDVFIDIKTGKVLLIEE